VKLGDIGFSVEFGAANSDLDWWTIEKGKVHAAPAVCAARPAIVMAADPPLVMASHGMEPN
jgi:hypothetical protein